MILQYSQIAEKITCAYRWDARYNRGIEPPEVVYPRDLGSAAHLCFANLWRDGTAYGDSWDEWRKTRYAYLKSLEIPKEEFDVLKAEFNEIVRIAPMIAERGYFHLVNSGWSVWTWDASHLVTDLEGKRLYGRQMIEVPIWCEIDGVQFRFTPDVLLKHPDFGLFVWDFKVRKQLTDAEYERMNLQKIMYQKGLRVLGVVTSGSGIIQCRSDVPAPVKINKDGTPSRADQLTTPEMYREVLRGLELNEEHYQDILMKLARKEWVKTNVVYRSAEELDAVWQQVVLPQLSRTEPIRSFGSFACNKCWMKEVCLQELRGDEVNLYTLTEENEDGETAEGGW